jgi:hypothetical protein
MCNNDKHSRNLIPKARPTQRASKLEATAERKQVHLRFGVPDLSYDTVQSVGQPGSTPLVSVRTACALQTMIPSGCPSERLRQQDRRVGKSQNDALGQPLQE